MKEEKLHLKDVKVTIVLHWNLKNLASSFIYNAAILAIVSREVIYIITVIANINMQTVYRVNITCKRY